MTKKHFIALARHLRKGYLCATDEEIEGYQLAISHVMDALQDDNERFNRVKFMAAITEGRSV